MCDRKQSRDENSIEKNSKEDEDMNTPADPKSVKSTEITFDSDREYENFIKYIENPPETSNFVKDLIKEYRKHGGRE